MLPQKSFGFLSKQMKKDFFNTPQPSYSTIAYKVKMEYGWNLWLKVSFIISTYTTKVVLKSLHLERRSFFYSICNFSRNSSYLWVRSDCSEMACGWWNFKNMFRPLPLFHFDRVTNGWIRGLYCVKMFGYSQIIKFGVILIIT